MADSLHALQDHFAETFGCTHNISWVNCFIRRNQNKLVHAKFIRCMNHIVGTKYIVLNCFLRTFLHQRNMFVRCCMEDDLWTIAAYQLAYLLPVTDRCNLYF